MKIHFAYYNQYKNGIDIAFADNKLLFLSCAEAEKNLHTTPNSQRLIDNLAIDNLLMYAALSLDCELQAQADVMDEDWSPQIFFYFLFYTNFCKSTHLHIHILYIATLTLLLFYQLPQEKYLLYSFVSKYVVQIFAFSLL